MSMMTDRDTPREAGKALFDRVYAVWRTLPADHRPRLVVVEGRQIASSAREADPQGRARDNHGLPRLLGLEPVSLSLKRISG